MRKAIEKNARLLALFAIACTSVISAVHLVTKDRIKSQEENKLINTLTHIINENSYNNDIYHTCIIINDTRLSPDPEKVYLAKNNNQPVAAAITTTAPDGYNGKIKLIVAINVNGTVTGVRTLKHQETPGLGDKIEIRKNQWINTFKNKKVLNDKDPRWAVRKDGGVFDQFTGATITPRAVVKAVHKTVLYFKSQRHQLFQEVGNCQEQS
ncbi:electron transport complex subunit RsxG [Thalassotalea piscium]|uniref:Ion-translocating oxidoreductase complex subunit G n=1 Tax=Thalassotalea piscium TaxID=1230533 RepID=A0A7X0NHN8_9GAMM|nr:electron transport complex subunit RsxG [Thalassotalea piscium]MBB6543633.1 electron transport complex protein RnfG [Thalassotalea piscium]